MQLDLTLAKVDRTRARSRGANFIINGNTLSVGSLLGGLTSTTAGGGGGTAATTAGGLLGPPGVIPTAVSPTATGTANIIAGFAPSQIQLLLAALKSEGLAKLVAAPTIVARSGEEADILVGGQVPVISAAAGINGPGVTYRPVGTELRFLPIVYGNGKIHITVSPRVAAVNNSQALVTSFGTSPAFDEERMTTSVIVEPGQTIAIRPTARPGPCTWAAACRRSARGPAAGLPALGPGPVGRDDAPLLLVPRQHLARAVTGHAHRRQRHRRGAQFRRAQSRAVAVADAAEEVLPQGLGLVGRRGDRHGLGRLDRLFQPRRQADARVGSSRNSCSAPFTNLIAPNRPRITSSTG